MGQGEPGEGCGGPASPQTPPQKGEVGEGLKSVSGRKLRAILQKAAPPALRVSQQGCLVGRGTRGSPQSGWQLPLHVRVAVAVTKGLATGRSPVPLCRLAPRCKQPPDGEICTFIWCHRARKAGGLEHTR